jgi:dipeptidyl aminopeptidase/acylaminoacyl peptidase
MNKSENIKKLSGEVESSEGLPIRYDLYHPREQNPEEMPLILFLHGFKGFKDWGTFPFICRQLSANGFAVAAVNFSLNGIGENPLQFDRLDLFSRETLSQDLDDVGSVLKAIKEKKITADGAHLNAEGAGILGHSRGGQTAISAAAEYDEFEGLVTWSAVADYNARWSDTMKNDWKTEGVTEIKNGRTGQIMPVKKAVYDDARENAVRVIALNRVQELAIPALFIHSRDDEAVPAKDAEQLYEACSSTEKELLWLEKTGHTFGGTHPFESGEFPPALQKAFTATRNWFAKYLK